MGELLRRYWMPIAAVAELDDHPTKPVRLLGETLVLYRDKAGNYGLVDRHCPHRRADLSYGWADDCGLRCHYHGWLWDHTGRCLQQPFEETAHPEARFKDRVRIKAYPVEAKAGLLWAYLGPPPAPLVPTWEPFTWANGFVQIVFSEVPCNWFQCQENSIDPVHFEWLHSNWSQVLHGQDGPRAPTHTRLGFDEFEHGFVYRRVREDTTEDDPLWTTGRVCLWPNCLYTGHCGRRRPEGHDPRPRAEPPGLPAADRRPAGPRRPAAPVPLPGRAAAGDRRRAAPPVGGARRAGGAVTVPRAETVGSLLRPPELLA